MLLLYKYTLRYSIDSKNKESIDMFLYLAPLNIFFLSKAKQSTKSIESSC